ncbi:hypothetical protein LOZ55_000916 [Ophidiomyces ophidiicola]|nr:hypothetical protein LOZ55_000916 [Ophidiomyces ophidiicola]
MDMILLQLKGISSNSSFTLPELRLKTLIMAKTLAIAVSLAISALAAPAYLDDSTGRIVGGSPAKLGQFPSMLAINFEGEQTCGAMLLGPKLALTAAHCIGTKPSGASVRAGSLNGTSGGIESPVKSALHHPEAEEHDIALMYLEKPIAETAEIKYAKLPPQGQDPKANSQVTVSGWGNTVYNGTSSPVLLYVSVLVNGREGCKAAYAKLNDTVTDQMVCAGGEVDGKDSCHGDSGGPLYEAGTNMPVGIVSWGHECGRKGYGGVYVRIGSYSDWIMKNKEPPKSIRN